MAMPGTHFLSKRLWEKSDTLLHSPLPAAATPSFTSLHVLGDDSSFKC